MLMHGVFMLEFLTLAAPRIFQIYFLCMEFSIRTDVYFSVHSVSII